MAGEGGRADRWDRPGDVDRGADPRSEARRRGAPISLSSPARVSSARWGRVAPRPSGASACSTWGSPKTSSADLAAPVGLDLGAISREETALSILAEIVAARHGRGGGRLAGGQGPHPRGPGLICGLILAAGAGTPFGEQPKLLGRARRAPAARSRDRGPVRGGRARADRGCARGVRRRDARARRFQARRAGDLRALGTTVRRPRFAADMSAVRAPRDQVIVTLGDPPRMTPELIARFISD